MIGAIVVAVVALTAATIVYVETGSGILGLSFLLGVVAAGGALQRYNE